MFGTWILSIILSGNGKSEKHAAMSEKWSCVWYKVAVTSDGLHSKRFIR